MTESGPDDVGVDERTLSGWIAGVVEGRERLAEGLILVVAAIVAWVFRFVQDDAFITYRFSRNMARGNGLVFNAGEKVEGYTNFLWTLIHVIPEKLGWSSPAFSQVFGVVLMVATVALVIRIADRLFSSRPFALLVALVLVANMTFLGYATGGLETMLQALCIMGVVWAVLPTVVDGAPAAVGRILLGAAAAGLAVLTRLDSVVLLVGLFAAVAYRQWKLNDRSVGAPARTLALTAAPFLVLVVPWVVWKLDFYGELLPNTFFAKSASGPLVPFLWGVAYIVAYVISYGAFLLIGRFRKYRKGFFAVPGVAALFAVVPLWLLYICWVGADFMEYRFMVVITPLLAMLAAWLIDRFVNLRTQALLVGVLLVFSLVHQVVNIPVPIPVLSFRNLSHWPNESKTTWLALGNKLHEQFPGGPDAPGQPTIAVAPLGVISYFSDLPAIDMLGLTDAWVARRGVDSQIDYPGHVKMAPPTYLARRGVDLIIGEPALIENADKKDSYRLSQLVVVYPVADLRDLPPTAKVIEIPANDQYVWPVIYLGGNAKVDAAIERNGWKVKPIDRRCDPEDLNSFLLRRLGDRTCPDL